MFIRRLLIAVAAGCCLCRHRRRAGQIDRGGLNHFDARLPVCSATSCRCLSRRRESM